MVVDLPQVRLTDTTIMAMMIPTNTLTVATVTLDMVVIMVIMRLGRMVPLEESRDLLGAMDRRRWMDDRLEVAEGLRPGRNG